MATQGEITQLLAKLREGNPEAREQLLPILYEELRRIARSRMRDERPGHTLSPTALVHEAYLRLFEGGALRVDDRQQLFAAASETMRRVLIDCARSRKRLKRGEGQVHLSLEEAATFLSEQQADELLALEEALVRLGEIDSRALDVLQLRFFGGLKMKEIADLHGVSSKTVQRTWVAARAWMRKEVAANL